MKTQFKNRFIVYVVTLLLVGFSLLQVGCVNRPLKKMKEGLSKASEDVLVRKDFAKQSCHVYQDESQESINQPAEEAFAVSPNINPSLRDDPEFGYVYLIERTFVETAEEMTEWLHPVTRRYVISPAQRKVDILNLKALSKDGEHGKIPINFALKEYADEDDGITEMLHRCSWFRIKFSANEDSNIRCIVRGFSPRGKFIYYKEYMKDEDKKTDRPTESNSKRRTIDVPKIPKTLLPL